MRIRQPWLYTVLIAPAACGGKTTAPPPVADSGAPDARHAPGPSASASASVAGSDASLTKLAAPSWSADRPRFCDQLSPLAAEPTVDPKTPLTVFGRMLDLEPNELGQPCAPLADVKVCLLGSDLCTQSNTDGFYVLDQLPVGPQEITFEKEGYVSFVRQVVMGGQPISGAAPTVIPGPSIEMYGPATFPVADFERSLAGVGQKLDPRFGYLSALVATAAAPPLGTPSSSALPFVLVGGVEMHLSPPSGMGPVYVHGAVNPETWDVLAPELTATEEGGWASWLNAEPGDYTIRFSASDGGTLTACSALAHAGWGLDDTGALRVRVHAGFISSFGGLVCSKAP